MGMRENRRWVVSCTIQFSDQNEFNAIMFKYTLEEIHFKDDG